jgi:hypothetical protein
MNDPGRLALPQRHAERVQDQLGAQMARHRPADDAAAEGVEHDGEVKKPGQSRDERYVRDPELIRAIGREVAIHEVRRRSRIAITMRGLHPAPPADTDDLCRSHQPSHTLLPDRPAFGSQLCVDPWGAICAARHSVDCADAF